MRDKEKKHRKGQETTIGKIIYGFLLFMPLIAIGVTCGYAMFNKNAYQSYSGTNQYEEVNYEDLEENKNYLATSSFITTLTTTQSPTYLYVDNFVDNKNLLSTADQLRVKSLQFYVNDQNIARVYFRDSNNSGFTYLNLNSNTLDFNFDFIELQTGTYTIDKYVTTLIVTNNSKIDNVFYYSVDKVTESPLFNWAQNSIIYTTTNNTCNALSITTPFIPLLLSYWLIISVIYFLYDIALMLVWLIHHKIHELQESL